MGIKEYLWIFLLGSHLIHASWNEDFDKDSRKLMEQFKEFEGSAYINWYDEFRMIREGLLKDGSLKRQIKEIPVEEKMILLRPRQGIVIKKRDGSRIQEVFAWETSLLLGSSSSIVPSFPVEISGKKVVVQQMEPFTFGKGEKEEISSSLIKKVTLEDYWRSHLQAYLLGIGDLLGRNIGVNSEGRIRFFDVEACFRYQNQPCRGVNPFSLSIGFLAESFNWPQYQMPLGKKEVEELHSFVSKLSRFEDKFHIYQTYRRSFSFLPHLFSNREISDFYNEAVFYCLNKIRDFPFKEGDTFADFFAAVYPRVALGLDALSQIVGRIYQRKVGYGDALIFIFRRAPSYKMTLSEKKAIDEWMIQYVD